MVRDSQSPPVSYKVGWRVEIETISSLWAMFVDRTLYLRGLVPTHAPLKTVGHVVHARLRPLFASLCPCVFVSLCDHVLLFVRVCVCPYVMV